VTQLGHVKDLATAFVAAMGNPAASREVFNISGERFVTFDGIAKACAEAMGAPEPEIVHFNAKDFDFGKKKVGGRVLGDGPRFCGSAGMWVCGEGAREGGGGIC
jgi:nucleoside-diphosphate-sugar epimerase